MGAPKILLGVSGGIAAYKAADIARALVKEGAEVQAILTGRAEDFVTPLTLATLTGREVARSEFSSEPSPEIGHIELARWGDALLVAPATANVLARLARGLGDDLLSTVALAFEGPVVVAPAMNPKMWDHEATREHVAALEARGVVVVPPEEGFVACGDEGPGRLAQLETIVAEGLAAGFRSNALAGRKVLVSAGPTHEPLDPARYLANRSSGKMGYAIARAAHARGAEVVPVSGPSALPTPFGVKRVMVETAQEMHDALFAEAPDADVIVKSAAVADHRPATISETKISRDKGEGYAVELVPNPDILRELCVARAVGELPKTKLIVGFAAETGDAVAKGEAKRERKGCDLLVANDVAAPGAGFGVDTNVVALIGPDGVSEWPRLTKRQVGERLVDAIVQWLRR